MKGYFKRCRKFAELFWLIKSMREQLNCFALFILKNAIKFSFSAADYEFCQNGSSHQVVESFSGRLCS